jgi:hypothetical protein
MTTTQDAAAKAGGCPPGMRGCVATCGHRQWVEGYREERERQEIVAENVSLGYDTEYAEWVADHPLPTLKEWMKHREKAPEMATDKPLDRATASDSERLANWDRPAEQERARALDKLDRHSEAAAENAEMKRYLAVDIDQPTVQEIRAYNETGLLGAAMVSDEALPALRTVRGEFSDVFHENVGRAILDQAADGAPHDSESITEVLRERNQLPLEHDPDIPMRTVDRGEYGLGAWERGAVPDDANALAKKIREAHRCDYLADVGQRLQQDSQTALKAGADPAFVFARSANELVNVPPRIDLDLRQLKNSASLDAVDTTKSATPRVITVPSEATVPRLGLPARPMTMNLKAVASA